MRTFKHFSFAFLIIMLSLSGCKKDEIKPSTNLADSGLKSFVCQDSAIAYAERNLLVIGDAVLSLSNYTGFKDSCYSRIESKFDGDYDVLLKTIIDKFSFNGGTFISRAAQQLNGKYSTTEISASIQAFNNIDSNNYFPQLFIPYYEKLQSDGILGTSNPVLVIAPLDDPDKLEHDGYKVVNGTIQKLNFKIDDDYASQNEVWVISINERVDNDGNVYTPNYKSISATKNCKIEKMTVKSHKESWVMGASEISIRSFLEYWDGKDPITGMVVDVISLRTSWDFRGIQIRQFSRSEINNQSEITLNYQIEDDWPYSVFLSDPIIYLTVIFEADNWPTGTKTEWAPLASSTPRYMTFRSADGSYHCGTLYSNTNGGQFQSLYADGFLKNDSGIKFNTKLY